MSVRDFRCVFSGVSLLGSEVAVVLLQRLGERWRPAALPLFGTYEGTGTVAEVNEGPNSELILHALGQDGSAGVVFDFEAMGLEPQPIEHIETFLGLVACSQLQSGNLVRASEGELGFALLSAHVAAALMEREPELAQETSVEGLGEVIFDSELARSIYRQVRAQNHRLRCKFGLSMVGLAALDQSMMAWGKSWTTPGPGIPLEEADAALWLTQATVEFSQDEGIIEALEDYAGQGEDEI